MSGSRAPATVAAVASLFIIALMMPLVSVDAAPEQGSRDADMEFLDYLGTFEADGKDALDPLALEQLETNKKKTEKPAGKKIRFRAKEKPSEEDVGNE
jgi:hypothetical protein